MGIAAQNELGMAAPGAGFEFVGREREMGLLLAAVRRPPAIVVVEGEAGIGKSRLVREASAVLARHGTKTLTGLCHPLREPFPFGPVVDALRKVGKWLPPVKDIPRSVGALAPLLPDLAERLPPLPAPAVDAQAERNQLVQGLRSLLDTVGPAVLVIEDLHWVDDATSELLVLLTRDMPAHLGLVLTFRAEDLRPGTPSLGSVYRRQPGTTGVAIHLDPLPEQAIRDLARSAFGADATPKLGRMLYDRSGGVPLVAEEDLISLSEHGFHSAAGLVAELEHADVPRGLQEVFTERLAALSPAASAVVEAAAVLDVPAAEPILVQVAGLGPEQGRRGVTEALRTAVLSETEPARYFFRHTLAQQVAYRRLPGPVRSHLHRRAIEVLENQSPPPLVQIAHHTFQLGDRSAWLTRAQAAADQAIALGDVGTATMLLRRIREQPGLTVDQRSRAALGWAEIAVRGIDFATNAAVLRRLLADPELPTAVRGDIRLSLGLLMAQAGDSAGFQEVAQAADELADRPERAARAMIALAMNERESPARQAWSWLERAELVARQSPDAGVEASLQATRLTLLAREGDAGVWALLDQMPRRSENPEVTRHSMRALFNVGELAMELGHDGRAVRLLTESRELARSFGSPRLECYSRIALLRLGFLAGDWTDVEKRFAVLHREFPDVAWTMLGQTIVNSMLAVARGQLRQAKELFTTIATYAETAPSCSELLWSTAGLAAVRLTEGAPQDAWTIVAPAVAILRRAEAWARGVGLLPVAVEAATACGDRATAEQLVSDAEFGLRGRDAPAATAELHLATGILHGAADPAAAQSFARARRLWSDIGRPYDTARATERLGVALAAAGGIGNREDGTGQAAACLEEALATYDRLGATCDVARCQRIMRGLGLARAPSRGRRGYGDELSPRERQVAELVARGATNEDIAHALFISPRTVEQHVAHALKKLGSTRRNVGQALRSGRR